MHPAHARTKLQLEGLRFGLELLQVGNHLGVAGVVAEGGWSVFCHVHHRVVRAGVVAVHDIGHHSGTPRQTFLPIQDGAQKLRIRGESLQQYDLRGKAEDRHARAGVRLFQILQHLVSDVGLCSHWCVQRIEQEYVEGAVCGRDGVVGECAGRELGQRGQLRAGLIGDMLLKRLDRLRMAALNHSEIGLGELVDRIMLCVAHHHIHYDKVRVGLDGGSGCLGGRLSCCECRHQDGRCGEGTEQYAHDKTGPKLNWRL